jgi:hypothetical protein
MSEEEDRESTLGVLPLPPDGVFTEEDREATLGILPVEDAPPTPVVTTLPGGGLVYVRKSKARRRKERRQKAKEAKAKPLQVTQLPELEPLVLDLGEVQNLQELIRLYQEEKALVEQQDQLARVALDLQYRQQQMIQEQELARQQAIVDQQIAMIKQKIADEETFLLLAITMM